MLHRSPLVPSLLRNTRAFRSRSRGVLRKGGARRAWSVESLEDRTLLSGTTSLTLELIPTTGTQGGPVTIALDSFQFGFHRAVTYGTGDAGATTTGKVTFDELDVHAAYGANSPLVLNQLASGRSYDSAVLSETDPSGKVDAAWTLSDVFATRDAIAGDAGSTPPPSEEWNFAFTSFTQTVSTATTPYSTSWDQTKQAGDGPAPASVDTLASNSTSPDSAGFLYVSGSGSNLPAVVPISSFQFSVQNNTSIGSASGGAGAGKVAFQAVDVSLALSADSSRYLTTLLQGRHYDKVILARPNASGQDVGYWAFALVYVTDVTISGNSDGGVVQNMSLDYGAVSLRYDPSDNTPTGWNQVTNSGSSSGLPTFDSLAGPSALAAPLATQATSAPANGMTLSFAGGNGEAINVPIDLDSYALGFKDPVSTSGTTPTPVRTSFDALTVTTAYNPASVALFLSLAKGEHYDTATLSQYDAHGGQVAEWALGTVFVTKDSYASSDVGLAKETVTFVFGSITEAISANSASWDLIKNAPDGPTAPDLTTLTPTPEPADTGMTLSLTDETGKTTSIVLDSYQFGFHNPATFGTSTGGAGASRPSFDSLAVSTLLSSQSISVFAALTGGKSYSLATLTQKDPGGKTYAVWTMSQVFVTTDDISNANAGINLPSEKLTLFFGAFTQTVSTATTPYSTSWDQTKQAGDGPAPASVDTLASNSTSPDSAGFLYVSGSGSDLPAVVPITSFQFSVQNNTSIGSASGGAGAGKVAFQAVDVSLALSADSSRYLNTLLQGRHYDKVILARPNASGQAVGYWAFALVYVTDVTISGNSDGGVVQNMSLDYGAVSLRYDPSDNTPTGWNQVTNSGSTLGLPTFDSLAGPSALAAPLATQATSAPANGMTLSFAGGNGEAINVPIELDSYALGFKDPVSFTGSGFSAGRISFDALRVTMAFNAESVALFLTMAQGGHYNTATLTQYNAQGDPVAVWAMGTVFVTGDGYASSDASLAEETTTFAFGSITEETRASTASWDLIKNAPDGPTAPDPSTLGSLTASDPTIVVSAGPFTYDGTAHSATATARSTSGGPVAGSFSFTYYAGVSVSGTGSSSAPIQAGTYTVVAQFTSDDPDYNSADSLPLTFTIAQAPLTITADTLTKTYGDSVSFAGNEFTTSGLVNGDTVASASLASDGAAATAGVAGSPYVITIGAASGTGLGNYAITYVNGSLNVNPKALTVTADTLTKTYGEPVSFTGNEFTTSGLVNGDSVASASIASDGAAATAGVAGSPYVITIGAASGTGLDNYAITYVNGSLDVNPKALTITAGDATKIVGEANPAFTVSFSGFVLGEGPSVLGGTLSFVTSAGTSSPAGTYTVTPAGLTSTNYAITFVSGTLTVESLSQATADLSAQVDSAGLPRGTQQSLDSQLQAAMASFARGQSWVGALQLNAFINHVSAERGKQFNRTLADSLIAQAQRIATDAEEDGVRQLVSTLGALLSRLGI